MKTTPIPFQKQLNKIKIPNDDRERIDKLSWQIKVVSKLIEDREKTGLNVLPQMKELRDLLNERYALIKPHLFSSAKESRYV